MADNEGDSLEGRILIAMPTMGDERFERTVIYMCAHSSEGAMGLILNKPADFISFPEILEHLGIESDLYVNLPGATTEADERLFVGGPVETGRGFVLHTSDYEAPGTTLAVDDQIGLTATVDILRDIAAGRGPQRSLLALGYSGWGPGQLESEIQANGWLHCDADLDLLFDNDVETKWARALGKIGVDVSLLSGDAGHA